MPPADKESKQDLDLRKESTVDPKRRAALRKLGRYAAITPPAVTLLMTQRPKRAAAASGPVSSRRFKEPVAVTKLQFRA